MADTPASTPAQHGERSGHKVLRVAVFVIGEPLFGAGSDGIGLPTVGLRCGISVAVSGG